MGLLKHFRSRSRLKDGSSPQPALPSSSSHPPLPTARHGRDLTQRLPARVLETIFAFVCPHTQDHTYEPSERSQIGDGCMLCDLRDLGACVQVCRRWTGPAQKLLYGSVRIDAVHYCALEDELAVLRRKRKHFRSKSSVALEPGDVPGVRLSLLVGTVRDNAELAAYVQVLKLPYMTRETAKGDLARAVSCLPNLRYVDLPDGFFTGDPSCLALRQELQMRCPEIRKMSYRSGSEDALELLAQRHWQRIEVLELSSLAIEPATLRIVLASLPTLRELTLSDLPWMDGGIFSSAAGQLPDFPPLSVLKLVDVPNVGAEGLKSYLEEPQNRETLTSLTLQTTGIAVADLSQILWTAPSLHHLSITEVVTKSLALRTQDLPPLTSISLQTLHFEITSSEEIHGLQKPAESHYAYLASSLHQNALPALDTLYVRDPSFPDLLLMPPLPPLGRRAASDSGTDSLRSKPSTLSAGSAFAGPGFTQTLEVFSKGIDELEWVFTSIRPPSPQQHRGSLASGGRPLSAYSASRGLGPQWAQGGFGGEARKSVVVGNGFGGFLAIPAEEAPRPRTADADRTGGSRWGSLASQGSGGGGGAGALLRPPAVFAGAAAEGRRGSRHDLWR